MRMKLSQYNRLRKRVEKSTGRKLPAAPKRTGADLTELKFARTILGNIGTFVGNKRKCYGIKVSQSGIIYTPDFIYPTPPIDGRSRIAIIEVKLKKYRSPKDQRLIKSESRTKWEVCGDLYPQYDFVWAEYATKGNWEIEIRFGNTQDRIKGVCRTNDDFEKLLKGIEI